MNDALDTALDGMEKAALHGFEGTQDELRGLLLEGLEPGGAVEADDAYWERVIAMTDRMAVRHLVRKPRS